VLEKSVVVQAFRVCEEIAVRQASCLLRLS